VTTPVLLQGTTTRTWIRTSPFSSVKAYVRIEAREIAQHTCGNEVALDVLDTDLHDTLNPSDDRDAPG
jgi:hypothetical protein